MDCLSATRRNILVCLLFASVIAIAILSVQVARESTVTTSLTETSAKQQQPHAVPLKPEIRPAGQDPVDASVNRAETQKETSATSSKAVTLWSETKIAAGDKIAPDSPEYKQALNEGVPLPGRTAPLEGDPFGKLAQLQKGDRVTIPLFPGEKVEGIVNLVQNREGGLWVAGSVPNSESATFAIYTGPKSRGGQVLLPTEKRGVEIREDHPGKPFLREVALSELVCYPIPRSHTRTAKRALSGPPPAPPILSSKPTAVAVLYLDFDGATVTDPLWDGGRTIVAPAYDLTSTEITQIFNRVKEDFLPFNVDVTTNATRYANAPIGRRMRCIITSNDAAGKGAGGIAYLESFQGPASGRNFSDDIPCWVFNSDVISIAEAASHELGHTFGLSHDGRTSPLEEYFEGHGSWAPIMGVGYDRTIVQWSKGEYANASQRQDDLAIITNSANGIGYAADTAGNTLAAAANLNAPGGTINQAGVIERTTDDDLYKFTVGTGSITVSATPAPVSPNLDIELAILRSDGTVLASANPTSLNASISSTIPTAGTYYIRVRGVGQGSPSTSGYSDYGSIGYFKLTGTLPAGTQAPVISSAVTASGNVGVAFSYQIIASNSPTSYGVTGTLPSGVSVNTSTGLISGTPSAGGTFDVTLRATNGAGSGTKALRITILSSSLANAIDAPSLQVTSSGSALWFPQTAVTDDGSDAARSGDVADSQTTTMQTTVTGPATGSFRWKADSEASFDILEFLVDGTSRKQLSGNADWTTETFTLVAGIHTLSWIYRKDLSISVGADCGFVDKLVVTPLEAPWISSPGSAAGTVGIPFEYFIAAMGNPTSFGFVGKLPPGLTLNTSTGKISGTPTTAGVVALKMTATNGAGTDSKDLTITINPGGISLATALDNGTVTWSTSGNKPWAGQSAMSFDGVDAAQSGNIGNSQFSHLQTTVAGPCRITFRWKVDSESGYDFLRFRMDTTLLAAISGTSTWISRSFDIPGGSHVLKWSYEKDEAIFSGADAGWVDQVVITRPPTNDPFAAAITIAGTTPTVTGSNVLATRETGEPLHAGKSGGRSVWWKWTAPSNGSITVTTDGSSFDTLLGVYRGTSVSALTTVSSNDDFGTGTISQVTTRVAAGAIYQVAVDGYEGATGSIRLRLVFTPD